jgi:hypothetical protein
MLDRAVDASNHAPSVVSSRIPSGRDGLTGPVPHRSHCTPMRVVSIDLAIPDDLGLRSVNMPNWRITHEGARYHRLFMQGPYRDEQTARDTPGFRTSSPHMLVAWLKISYDRWTNFSYFFDLPYL